MSDAGSDLALHQQANSENLLPETENDKPVLHAAFHLYRFGSQQFFKFVVRNEVNPFGRMMTEELDHASGRLQVFPDFIKGL